MKFHYLHDPLLGLLYEDDDIIAIDKPYGLDSHTNESKTGNEGFIVPGLIEIFEANLDRQLHIIHRLDRTTTGVIVFGKTLVSAKKYQQFFRNRESKKTYLFVTAARSNNTQCETSHPILHKGAELGAQTSFSHLKTGRNFDLWEARPHTGRKHQIRIHAAHVGLPLLGDKMYGGAPFPFLCLHNRRLQFPNGIAIESRPPSYFEDLRLLEDQNLVRLLHEVDRRQRLFPEAFNGAGLQNDSLRILKQGDREGGRAILDLSSHGLLLTWNDETWSPSDEQIYKTIATYLNKPMRVRFTNRRLRDESGEPFEKLLGPEQNPATDFGTGAFADQRLQLNWISENARNKTVLVLFSSTGAYAAAASRGGASGITCIETSKSALTFARENFTRNGLPLENTKFLNRESPAFLDQCKSKGLKFDLVICDAPSFSRGEKRHFRIEHDIQEILTKAIDVLHPMGQLLFSTGAHALFVNDVRRAILRAQSALGLKDLSVANIQSSLDCSLPGEKPTVKSVLISRASSSI
jgi:23S rRNA (cytosine1962-C5)-methyltransferase